MNVNEIWLHQQKEYARTQKPRINKVNICVGRANWDTCDYRDAFATNAGEYGIECYVQDKHHTCCKCIEVERRAA
jgi:hypothetical protein